MLNTEYKRVAFNLLVISNLFWSSWRSNIDNGHMRPLVAGDLLFVAGNDSIIDPV